MWRLSWCVCVVGLGCASEEQEDALPDEPLPLSTERQVLYEVFTGSNCGPCLGADALLDEVFHETKRRYSSIKYQVGSDPYMTQESVSRRMYYLPGESSYPIPYVHADGIYGFHPAEVHDGEGYMDSDMEAFADVPALVRLEVGHSITDQTVDFEVRWTALDLIEGESLVLHAVIIENITTLNVGSNGQAEFHQVMKKMVPDGSGTPMESLDRGDEGTLSLSYTFNGAYDPDTSRSEMVDHVTAHTVEEFEDLEVVVWLQDSESWEVLQSAWTID